MSTIEQGKTAIVLVAARARNGVIGRDGGMPWAMPGDLRHFKALTLGHPLIMGRRTYGAIGRPLPGRPTLVLTRDAGFSAEGVAVAADIGAALDWGRATARALGVGAVMVVGGAEVYAAALPFADRLVISELDLEVEGDTVFPRLDVGWRVVERVAHPRGAGDDAGFDVVTYERRSV
ncbi:MAG: dihydrofolate reductase [Zavarzinia sp.]|nr:dihydrofolate reductase [Zavarzinia sp.]